MTLGVAHLDAIERFTRMELVVADHVATLTLTRPDQLNQIDQVAHAELTAAIRAIGATPGVRAAVVTAQGRVFSAGGDFDMMIACSRDRALREELGAEGRQLIDALLDLQVPLIAALNGHAVGLGATLTLGCDAVIAHRGVALSDPHVSVGLAAGDGGCIVWPMAVGMIRARRHLLTGDRLSAEEAHRLGIVTDLVDDPAEVLPAAEALAARIAALAPVGVQGTKRTLNHIQRLRMAEALEVGLAHELDSFTTDDHREAVDAARSRRAAVFRGV